MGYRKQNFAEGEYYHLYNRGIEKRTIFLDKHDYDHFMLLLYLCNSSRSITLRDIGKTFDRGETITDIGAYCLMPNHFHILIREKIEGGTSLYMKKLLTGYAMYFNKKYKRTGHLFENTFKSSYAGSDNYLKYLYAYIHLNPVKLIDKNWKTKPSKSTKVMLKYAFDYLYSSLQEYDNLTESKDKLITNSGPFPRYFSNPVDHKKELYEWLTIEDTP